MTTDTLPGEVTIIGGGPAGLTAAYELQKRSGVRPIVYEGYHLVGGISRTETHDGYRSDIGGHRFFTKVPEVQRMWTEVLGDQMIIVERLSRIYYRGRFFRYPLKLFNALRNIGVYESIRILLSYGKWRMRPSPVEDSFEQWVMNRFGGRLYMHFFRSYTQKVWGIPPREIRADWAAQRIKNLSLTKAVWNAMGGGNSTVSLIEEFQYPRLGPGQMWEMTADSIRARNGEVHLNAPVTKVHRTGNRIDALTVAGEKVEVEEVVNTMALRDLIRAMDPPAPDHVVEAAERLRYRDFLIVTLVLNEADPFPDNWIYVHSPEVSVGRIQNFRAWSKDMLPNQDTASIGMEYFCHEGDELWSMSDDDLRDLAARELDQLGLASASSVIGAAVIRQPKAYPVYDGDYRASLDVVQEWLSGFENMQTVGRNGLHRYNNQDHSMLSAIYAARNILGSDYDVWEVNVDRSYHEEFETPEAARRRNLSAQQLDAQNG